MKFYKLSSFSSSFIFLQWSYHLDKSLPSPDSWINGFAKPLAWKFSEYDSCLPEATNSLLIRCLNDKDNIEWITDSVPVSHKGENVTFV